MGRHGPLTSLALGRSPYDEVVPGEGVSDACVPSQMYDERGRPVNPATKSIMKSIVRAHNEVMLTIGVAEPESSAFPVQADLSGRRDEYENRAGRYIRLSGIVAHGLANWSFDGIRQRIMIFSRYSHIPLGGLWSYQLSQQSPGLSLFAGLPCSMLGDMIEDYSVLIQAPLARAVCKYVSLHMKIYSFIQHLGLIRTAWFPFPNLSFFLPGASFSPIPLSGPAAPPISPGLMGWCRRLALGVLPFAGFFVFEETRKCTIRVISAILMTQLPQPTKTKAKRPREAIRVENPAGASGIQEPSRGAAASPVAAVRRQSTGSSTTRAPVDDFGSDDGSGDEHEPVSTTLISIDLEGTDPTDTPPGGAWSAELRPNVTDDREVVSREPNFRYNILTQIPSKLVADSVAMVGSRLLTEWCEGIVLGKLAELVLRQQALPLGDLRTMKLLDGHAYRTLLGVNAAHQLFLLGMCAGFTVLAYGCLATTDSAAERDARDGRLRCARETEAELDER